VPLITEVHGWKKFLLFAVVIVLAVAVASLLWFLGLRPDPSQIPNV